jgi:exosortase/archaeosortase family protein
MVDLKQYLRVSKEKVKKTLRTLIKILPIMAFVPAFVILYYLYPANFQVTWKGRLYYVFFIWLASLEVIMSWENLVTRVKKLASLRNAIFIISFFLPTAYVIVSNFLGLNTQIVNWSQMINIGRPSEMPISIEYLVFASFFVLLMWSQFGFAGLKGSPISPVFLATIGIIYTIDSLYPYGSFTPFQALVPTTSNLAASFFNLMGYKATTSNFLYSGTWVTLLQVQNPRIPINVINGTNPVYFNIAWPCAGVESLIIYTGTILIALKGSAWSWKRRAACFSVGAIVTYFVNVLRIAIFVVLGFQYGYNSPQVTYDFHDIYGSLYSITWIVSYLLIIMGSQTLGNRANVRGSDQIPGSKQSLGSAAA